jgi:hypothetical protein
LVLVKSQIVENAIEHQLKLRNVTISNVAVFAVSQNCISGVAPDGAEDAANDERAKTSANQPKTNRQQESRLPRKLLETFFDKNCHTIPKSV